MRRVETLGWRHRLYSAEFEARLAGIESDFGGDCVQAIRARTKLSPRIVVNAVAPFVSSLIARRPHVHESEHDALMSAWNDRLRGAAWAFRHSWEPLVIGDAGYVMEEARIHLAVGDVLVTADWAAAESVWFGTLWLPDAAQYNRRMVAASGEFVAARKIQTLERWLPHIGLNP